MGSFLVDSNPMTMCGQRVSKNSVLGYNYKKYIKASLTECGEITMKEYSQDYLMLMLWNLKSVGIKTVLNILKCDENLFLDWHYENENFYLAYLKYLKEVVKNNMKLKSIFKKITVEDIEMAERKAIIIDNDCIKEKIQFVCIKNSLYPYKLKHISDPPIILFYKGDIGRLSREHTSIAVIGSREPLEFGMKVANRFGEYFAKKEIIVVSGLAIGCDTGGHQGCVKSDGVTVAVMAGGLEQIYPPQNKCLAEKILQKGGCLLSELAPYVKPFKATFVKRDRLQSGLSDGIVVVETSITGGTLHTVEFARKQGRYIGVYNHEEKFKNEKVVQGNISLLKESGIISLKIRNDIDKFIKKCRSKVYNNMTTKNIMNNLNENEKTENEDTISKPLF